MVTRGIKHWGLGGYANILPRIKFGITGQVSSPQFPTISYRRTLVFIKLLNSNFMDKTKFTELILRLIIGLTLLILLTVAIIEIVCLKNDLFNRFNIDFNIIKVFIGYVQLTYYTSSVLLLLAVIGFYIKNRVGWILLNALFLYKTLDILFIRIPYYSGNLIDYLAILIPICLVLIINLKAFRIKYLIQTDKLISANLVALFIGTIFTLIKGYLFLNHSLSITDLFEKLK